MHSFICRIFQIICYNQTITRGFDQFLGFFYICTLQTNNNWFLHANLLCSTNDTHRNNIATHDTTENIHQNCFHLLISIQQLKSLLHLCFTGSTSDIQEIGWFPSFQLDDIHCCHGKTCTINHATNVSTQTNVVQVRFGRFYFSPILLRAITMFEHSSLTEFSIVIKVDLGITHNDTSIRSFSQRIDFYQGAIMSAEHFVQFLYNRLAFCMARSSWDKSQRSGEESRLLILDSLHDINWLLENQFWCSSCDIFD
mmetsp:Transcript_36502/g.27065  ORF Transcript_36502/g.27065 Transcript_36502/m.27065 type:complete len:254 (-) Transcript_36502:528-1289(-)